MKKITFVLLILTLTLSACSLPGGGTPASGVQAWIDQPVPGSILPLGAFPLKAHARHVDGSGVTRVEFLVNGVPIGAVDTDPAAPIVYGETSWNASEPGQYILIVRAYAGEDSSDSLPVPVCVSPDVKEALISSNGQCDAPAESPVAPADGSDSEPLPPDKLTEIAPLTATVDVPTDAPPTATFTLIPPTLTPVPATATPVPPTATLVVDGTNPTVDITLIQPGTLYYGGGCSANSGILTVEAYVADDGGVGDVYLVYGFVGAGAEGIFVTMAPIGGGYYRAIVDVGAQAYNFFQGANGEIGIAVIGNDLAGNSAQDTGSNVPLQFCPG